MAKSKRRQAIAATQQSNRESWKSMTPEARKEWDERRRKTAKSGYAKRQRERAAGKPMSDRRGETPAWTLRAFGPSLQRMAAHVGLVPESALA